VNSGKGERRSLVTDSSCSPSREASKVLISDVTGPYKETGKDISVPRGCERKERDRSRRKRTENTRLEIEDENIDDFALRKLLELLMRRIFVDVVVPRVCRVERDDESVLFPGQQARVSEERRGKRRKSERTSNPFVKPSVELFFPPVTARYR
jgi:hypothetical protein